ncbi:hypothetical protein [Actinomadura sp. WMMA1423]|uniref:hypothetical protein n=1 Tax=Actinomadura sp. WMMA1423 TaxID=2591108 RepID=UPI0011466BC6|nr:hypothetical protein [Actinomadura sp. WMMA1423]
MVALAGATLLVSWGIAGGIDAGCDHRLDSRGRSVCGVPDEGMDSFAAAMTGLFLGVLAAVGLGARVTFNGSWWPALGITAGAAAALPVFAMGGVTTGEKIMLCIPLATAVIVPWVTRYRSIKRADRAGN